MVSNRKLGGKIMDNYWFLYNTNDGSIYGSPYRGGATEWTNIPDGCGVIGFTEDKVTDLVKDAFVTPAKYKIVNGELTVDNEYVEPTITIQPSTQDTLNAQLLKANAEQQTLNANLLKQIAQLQGGSTNA
jgi:hypothetical protein